MHKIIIYLVHDLVERTADDISDKKIKQNQVVLKTSCNC